MHALKRLRRTLIWMLPGVIVIGALGAVFVRTNQEALDDLERAREAAGEARGHSARIADHLERIASNLEEGAEIPAHSGRIRDLTAAQRGSLENLIELLAEQLEAIRDSARLVESTGRSAEDVARLSDRQTEMLERAVAALELLEEVAADAGTRSAELAHAARYAARLAEDSRDAFSVP